MTNFTYSMEKECEYKSRGKEYPYGVGFEDGAKWAKKYTKGFLRGEIDSVVKENRRLLKNMRSFYEAALFIVKAVEEERESAGDVEQ